MTNIKTTKPVHGGNVGAVAILGVVLLLVITSQFSVYLR